MYKVDWGYVKVVGILCQLFYEVGGIDVFDIGMGVLIMLKVKLSDIDDLCFIFFIGSGLGCYVVLNVVQGVVYNEEIGSLDVIDLIGYGVVYCYMWIDKVCISIMFLVFDVDVE